MPRAHRVCNREWRTRGIARLVLFALIASCGSSGGGVSDPGGTAGWGGRSADGQGGSGGGGITTAELGAPVEVSSVLLPQINPAWPLGEWDGALGAPKVVEDCGTSQQAYQQVYNISVTAGAGLDFTARTIVESGVGIGDWTGTLSEDRQFFLVPAMSNPFTNSGGTLTTFSRDPLTFKLVDASVGLTARLYVGAHSTTGSQTCSYRINDYEMSNYDHRLSTVLQGTTQTTLDPPVALTRWGSFPVSGMGFGHAETSFRRALTPVLDGGSMPEGIVLDEKAWAVKVATNALWFYVMQGFSNKGSQPICMNAGTISSVENSANLPVYKSLSSDSAAPSYSRYSPNLVCLRSGESGLLAPSAWPQATQRPITMRPLPRSRHPLSHTILLTIWHPLRTRCGIRLAVGFT